MTAMQFSRYAAGYLPETGKGTNLVLAVSVSGQVSRTVEAMELAHQAGATSVAITGNPAGALAEVSALVVETIVPPLPGIGPNLVVPGTRSYIASQLALYLIAIHIGQQRGNLTKSKGDRLRWELAQAAALMEKSIAESDPVARGTAESWLDSEQFLFCGAGPSYGAALFNAAKLLEASGDIATGQDMEEWAHLEYFGRQANTPTFLISAGGWDAGRVEEIAEAASRIGRRLASITPVDSSLAQSPYKGVLFPVAGPLRECFSPLLTSLPGMLFAAYRAQLLDEPYFRAFSGGRSAEGGGGISRIRTSQRISQVNREP
jgi:glucosamine--fructose-6-phosphate aminotransferase (isomerizing)